jgi:hypothetical protein
MPRIVIVILIYHHHKPIDRTFHEICFPCAITKALCFKNIKRACYESGGVFHMFVRNKIAIVLERLSESNGI